MLYVYIVYVFKSLDANIDDLFTRRLTRDDMFGFMRDMILNERHDVIDRNYDDSDSNLWNIHDHGISLINKGRFTDAIKEFDKILNSDRSVSRFLIDDTWDYVGFCLLELDNFDQAVKIYESLLLDYRHNPYFMFKLAYAYLVVGQHSNALDLCDSLMQYGLDDVYALLYLCPYYVVLERPEKSLECADCAIKLDPYDSLIPLFKGIVLKYYARHNEALEAFEQSLKCNNQSLVTWGFFVECLISLNRPKDEVRQAASKMLDIVNSKSKL